MSFTLNVEVGGLCLLVRRTRSAEGLWILMPKFHTHHSPDPRSLHCALLVTSPANNSAGGRKVVPLKGKDLDLTAYAPNNSATPILPDGFAPISRWTNRPVVNECFDTDLSQLLEARVRLPHAKAVVPLDPPANLRRDGGSELHLNGRGSIEVEMDGEPKPVNIAGEILEPDAQGQISIALLNIPFSHFDHSGNIRHPEDEEMTHIQSYYPLVGLPSGPTLRAARPVTGGEEPAYKPCPTMPVVVKSESKSTLNTDGPLRIMYVDPYNCTVGAACPPDEPNC